MKFAFTERELRYLKPTNNQTIYWDAGSETRGLSLLVSPGGTKTFRSRYKLHGHFITRKLGRFPDLDLDTARTWARADRRMALEGVDPRAAKQRAALRAREQELRNANLTFSLVVRDFIEQYAKPRQKSWQETQRVLERNCVPAWGDRLIVDITKADAYGLLNSFIADGHGVKARHTLSWMRKLWRWAWECDKVPSPLMDGVKIYVDVKERDRRYDDDEIRTIWRAAERLTDVEGTYVKLLLLLAPRKNELARMIASQLDDARCPTLWTTPFAMTKSRKTARKKREYLTPLHPIVSSLFTRLVTPDTGGDAYVFPGRRNAPLYAGSPFKKKLVMAGAPADFTFHACRHTVATFLENKGHSEWERGLVLNHASTSVTAGYSHGYPLELKLSLLGKWTDHVVRIVS